ncbi:MAG: peptide deformylase [Capsulimonadales bacterium]|nr:peptide deformylase [Capsulimonadales bacterium]
MSAATETPSETPSSPPEDSRYNVPFDDSRIIKYGEPGGEILRRVADEVKVVDADLRDLIREMGDLMYAARGVGLAAPQVGKSIRLLVYDTGSGLRALINPTLSKLRGEQYEPEEGCLSIPGLRGVVRRAREVTVNALSADGRPIRFRATDFEARCIQHEVDHLNGVLFVDLAEPKSLHMLTPEEIREEQAGPANAKDIPPAE